MDKLIIQIPCYNEAENLPVTLEALPRSVRGVDRVEWLVVDDGSEDATAEVACQHGADHVVELPRNQGLAEAFLRGMRASVERGADVVVNTDADNQYDAACIDRLIAPIVEDQAEIVVGERPIGGSKHFSWPVRILQRFGSWVVRKVSGTEIPDTTSGFRAVRRDAAIRLHVFNSFTYTLETIIQAGHKGMAITSVPVSVNRPLRSSRLYRSVSEYVRRQALAVIRIFVTYKPFPFFSVPGGLAFAAGLGISIRFMYFYLGGEGSGHVQSLILSALLMGTGFFLIVIGLVTDLISVNRQLLEEVEWRQWRQEEMEG